MDNNYVLAMYDVRGIQDYIFRTNKVKDAIGASAIVENIISDALQYAVKRAREQYPNLTCNMAWEDGEQPLPFHEDDIDVQVLFVGGGNGMVLFSDREQLYQTINRYMSLYVMEHTYSLQLAIAVTAKTDNYANDYKTIQQEMVRVKAAMELSRPLGALPIMSISTLTGNPVHEGEIRPKENKMVDHETFLKLEKEKGTRKVGKGDKTSAQWFEEYIEEKGTDSTIAIVHIDGNNMGLRIKELVSGKQTYTDAVSLMRKISFNINHGYKGTFDEMARFFNDLAGEGQYSILKILVAGDDITYVARAKDAIASVEYFCEKIVERTMTGDVDEVSIEKYGFTVCAGVSFFYSHFPFSIAYEVAEACCESAKSLAKKNKLGEKVGNWVDFQMCRNVQSRDLEQIRCDEYVTSSGELLLARPYAISVYQDSVPKVSRLETLSSGVTFFQNTSLIAKSVAKDLRNTYGHGKLQMARLVSLWKSRNRKLPDETYEMYVEVDGVKIAKWYDALEIMEVYRPLSELRKEEVEHE